MATAGQHADLVDKLNRCMPVADDVKLGTMLQEVITAYNDLATKYNAHVTAFNAMLAKLDADDGLDDDDYVSSHTAVAASSADIADINERG